MSEEIQSAADIAEEITQQAEPSKIPAFKNVCLRLGLMMIVVFVSRGVRTIIASLLAEFAQGLGVTAGYLFETGLSLVFLYLIPMSFAVWIMKEPTRETCSRIYAKPQYFGRAMGMFPAFYGLAIGTNLIVMFIAQFITNPDLSKSFNTMNDLRADNMVCAGVLLFQLVVIAPILEELWFRGIVMESLRPYGNGFAIFVSAFLFGLTHANFQQFFYAFVIGICLGYIAVSTKSIVTTMVMHALFNSISGFMLFFMSVPSVADYLIAAEKGEVAAVTGAVVVWLVFMALVVLLMIVGLIMAVFKLAKIKKYRVPKMWTELTAAKRWGIFFSRVSVIVMLILAADTFTFRFVPRLIYGLIAGE